MAEAADLTSGGWAPVALFTLSVLLRHVMSNIFKKRDENDLDDKYVEEFINKGVVVIPNLLSASEVQEARRCFHEDLLRLGCDHDNLLETAGALAKVSSTGGAGGILDIFYADWKLSLNEHPRIVAAYIKLLKATYAAEPSTALWRHPFGTFKAEDVYMYIDRCCFRVPDFISKHWQHKKKGLQRSLTPHLDCCPHKLFSSEKKIPKWRPIQAFIALTDTINADEGGFEAAPYMHTEFDKWVANRPPSVASAAAVQILGAEKALSRAIKTKGNNPKYAGDTDQSSNIRPASANKKGRISRVLADKVANSSGSDGSDDQKILTDPPCVGDFTPIRPKEDNDILKLIKHIPIRAGDLVCWDYRTAHANSRRNKKNSAREVVYLGFLPGIEMNKVYANDQLERFNRNEVPSDQWHEHSGRQECSHKFSPLGRKMMTIDSYCNPSN